MAEQKDSITKCNLEISYLQGRIIDLEHHLESQIASLKEATTIAKASMDIRLESMNEFRSQLKDQANTLCPKSEFSLHVSNADVEFKYIRTEMEKVKGQLTAVAATLNTSASSLEKRLEGMNEFRSQLKDQASGFFTRNEHEQFAQRIEEDIRSLRESRAELGGKASALQANITLAIAIIGLALSAISIIYIFSK